MKLKDPVTAQQLVEWVAIEAPQVITDDQGGHEKEWASVYGCWARIDPVMPTLQDEAWHVEQHIMACRYRVWMRNDFPMTPNHRLFWGGLILKPLSTPVFIQKKMYQTFMTQAQ